MNKYDIELPPLPPPELMRLMPEVLASLKGSGVDVSLAADVERALAAVPAQEPVKVPSDEELYDLAESMDAVVVCSGTGDYNDNVDSIVDYARAVLARYGQPAGPEGLQLVPKEPSAEEAQPRQEPAVTPEEEEAWRALERTINEGGTPD